MNDFLETHERYASLFDGIDSVIEVRQTDKTVKPTWEKPLMLLDHMDEGYDYLMWLDDDAGFIRFDVDFRRYFPKDGKLFYFTQEREWFEGVGKCGRFSAKDIYLNAGVFFVKCCEESKKILKEWYSNRKVRYVENLNDQPVIIRWYLDHKDICGLADSKIFNAFMPDYDNGPVKLANAKTKDTIVLHLAAHSRKHRGEYFGTRKKVETMEDDWED
jgi:hypothetical protein